jgi:hypothetical protein
VVCPRDRDPAGGSRRRHPSTRSGALGQAVRLSRAREARIPTDKPVPYALDLTRGQLRGRRDDRCVALSEPRPRHQLRAEDVGVDDDRTARPGSAHTSIAARKASPSSSVRSSITISLRGGSGRARRSSSSTGSSRCCPSVLSARSVDTVTWSVRPSRSALTGRSPGGLREHLTEVLAGVSWFLIASGTFPPGACVSCPAREREASASTAATGQAADRRARARAERIGPSPARESRRGRSGA